MKIILVACVIIIIDDKVLAVQRSKEMNLPLKWEFHGGKIEKGETEIEFINKEIFEELNIKIEIKKRLIPLTYEYPDFKINLIPFLTNYILGELILKEHLDLVIANKNELINFDWAEADLPILKEFLEL